MSRKFHGKFVPWLFNKLTSWQGGTKQTLWPTFSCSAHNLLWTWEKQRQHEAGSSHVTPCNLRKLYLARHRTCIGSKGLELHGIILPANGSYIFLWQSSLESVLSYEQSSGDSGNYSGRSPTSRGRADQAMGNAGSGGWSNASNWVFHCGCLLVFWKGQMVKSD